MRRVITPFWLDMLKVKAFKMQDELSAAPTRPLTRRQHECVELVTEGLTSKEIARKLGIAPSTVDNHIAQVMHQLSIPNRAVLKKYNLGARLLNNSESNEEDYSDGIYATNFPDRAAGDAPVSVEKIDRLRKIILVFSGVTSIVLAILIVLSAVATIYIINLYRP